MENEQIKINIHERLATLETQQETFMHQIENLDAKIDKNHEEIKLLIENGLNSKAGKWVEKVLIWFGAAVGMGLLAYFGTLLIKLIEL